MKHGGYSPLLFNTFSSACTDEISFSKNFLWTTSLSLSLIDLQIKLNDDNASHSITDCSTLELIEILTPLKQVA